MDLNEKNRAALIIAHPGHELRIWNWVAKKKPLVVILTDGASVRNEIPRIMRSIDNLRACGAIVNTNNGVSDATLYSKILNQDYQFFFTLSDAIANMLIQYEIHHVVCDAIEGYNPTHDLCHVMTHRAVQIAQKNTTQKIINHAFNLVGSPLASVSAPDSIKNFLTENEYQEKLEKAKTYVNYFGGMLDSEVNIAFDAFGERAFQNEVLFLQLLQETLDSFLNEKPFYETYAEKKAKEGSFSSIIRFKQHVLPIIKQLKNTGVYV